MPDTCDANAKGEQHVSEGEEQLHSSAVDLAVDTSLDATSPK